MLLAVPCGLWNLYHSILQVISITKLYVYGETSQRLRKIDKSFCVSILSTMGISNLLIETINISQVVTCFRIKTRFLLNGNDSSDTILLARTELQVVYYAQNCPINTFKLLYLPKIIKKIKDDCGLLKSRKKSE